MITTTELNPGTSDNSKVVVTYGKLGSVTVETYDCVNKVANVYIANEEGLEKIKRMINVLKDVEKHLKVEAKKGFIKV